MEISNENDSFYSILHKSLRYFPQYFLTFLTLQKKLHRYFCPETGNAPNDFEGTIWTYTHTLEMITRNKCCNICSNLMKINYKMNKFWQLSYVVKQKNCERNSFFENRKHIVKINNFIKHRNLRVNRFSRKFCR